MKSKKGTTTSENFNHTNAKREKKKSRRGERNKRRWGGRRRGKERK